MKIAIDLPELPLHPKITDAKNSAHVHATRNCALELRSQNRITIYTPDFGVTYEVVVDSKGRATLKELFTEACQR